MVSAQIAGLFVFLRRPIAWFPWQSKYAVHTKNDVSLNALYMLCGAMWYVVH